MTSGIITKLRDTVPIRPHLYGEALRIAELQARRFLELSGISEPAVPERVIAELPRIHVARLSPFPTSGATHRFDGRWLVALNGSEPLTRQRFSLAHELKHIIDHRFVNIIYTAFPERERAAMVEHICDFFAGCLLMPRPWLKRAYYGGTQFIPDLAEMFGVSQAAITVRLKQIGISGASQRCGGTSGDWTYQAPTHRSRRKPYLRRAAALV